MTLKEIAQGILPHASHLNSGGCELIRRRQGKSWEYVIVDVLDAQAALEAVRKHVPGAKRLRFTYDVRPDLSWRTITGLMAVLKAEYAS